MAQISPFKIPGGHILSSYAARKGLSGVRVKELRLSTNGWVNQSLIHTAGPLEELLDEDLNEYFTAKRWPFMPATSSGAIARSRIARTLRNSEPLTARFDLNTDAWVVEQGDSSVLSWPSALDSLSDNLRQKHDDGSHHIWLPKRTANPGTLGEAVYACPSMILDWDMTTEKVASLIDLIDLKAPNAVGSNLVHGRMSPRAWFEQEIVRAGLPLHLFKFRGVIGDGGYSNLFSIGCIPGYEGCTTIMSPADCFARRLVYSGPRLGQVVRYCIMPHTIWDTTGAGTMMGYTLKYRGIAGDATVSMTQVNLDPISSQGRTLSTGASPVIFGVTLKAQGFEKMDLEAYNAAKVAGGNVMNLVKPPAPAIEATIPFMKTTECVRVMDNTEQTLYARSNLWRIAKPNGLIHWTYKPTTWFMIKSESVDDLETYSISPETVHFRQSMATVHVYLTEQLGRSDLTAKDRANLVTAKEKSGLYIDGTLSTTVTASSATPVSAAMVSDLEMVRRSAEGDVDLMNEDLGDGWTLKKMATKLDADRAKGLKYLSYTRVLDESATVSDMVSARVSGTAGRFELWLLSLAVSPTDGNKVITGRFGTSQIDETLTDVEAMVILAGGGRTTGSWSDPVTTLGWPDTWAADMTNLGTAKLLATTGLSYQGTTYIPWDKFDPRGFSDEWGYPITTLTDLDSIIRFQVLFKGQGDDASRFACLTFFANNLDFA